MTNKKNKNHSERPAGRLSDPRPLEGVNRELKTRKAELEKLIKKKQGRIAELPQGHLCVVKPKGSRYVQYYHATYGKDGKETRTYLSKQDTPLMRQLAQKEYDRKVITAAKQELQVIDRYLKSYPARLPEDIYNNYMEERRELITPIITPLEKFVAQWQDFRYKPNPYPMEKAFPTARGELVRSKSEVEIANYLYYHNIPYRYECPLSLKDGSRIVTFHPDFMILDTVTREVILLEHLGRMDDPTYVDHAMEKRRIYEENGFFEGENILYTWENGEHPLTRRQVERKLKHRLRL